MKVQQSNMNVVHRFTPQGFQFVFDDKIVMVSPPEGLSFNDWLIKVLVDFGGQVEVKPR